MKISTYRIMTADHIELFGLLYEPESKSDIVLVHVHGMAGNFYENHFLDAIAKALTDNGIAFLAFNNRGCEYIKDMYTVKDGKRDIVRIGDTFERFEDCLLDIGAAIDLVRGKGYEKIHLSGHSLGGPKIAYYATEKDDRLSSLIFLAPADMVGLTLMEKNYAQEYETVHKMIAEGRGKEMVPGMVWEDAFLSADSYVSLSDKGSKVAIFNVYDPEDSLSVLGKIKIPAYTIIGNKDKGLTIPIDRFLGRIQKALVNSPRAEVGMIDGANHGYWGHEQELADKISGWIQKN